MSLARKFSRNPQDEMENHRIKRAGVTPQDAASWQTRMRTAFFEAITEDDMREVVQGLVAKAKSGDMAAIRMLLSYGIGSPSVQVKNAVIVQGNQSGHQEGLTPLPTAPCKLMPATEGKLSMFETRAAAGQPLFDSRDSRRDLS